MHRSLCVSSSFTFPVPSVTLVTVSRGHSLGEDRRLRRAGELSLRWNFLVHSWEFIPSTLCQRKKSTTDKDVEEHFGSSQSACSRNINKCSTNWQGWELHKGGLDTAR